MNIVFPFQFLVVFLLLLSVIHSTVVDADITASWSQYSNMSKHRPLIAFASPSIPPPPPISMPVWSLSSPLLNVPREGTSMNIVTFATPVSVAPPKLWTISLYRNTLTKEAFFSSGIGILQLLNPSQKSLVPLLGKRSGYEEGYYKRNECQKVGYTWIAGNGCNLLIKTDETTAYDGDDGNSSDTAMASVISQEDRSALESIELLPECAAYILVKLLPRPTIDAGDHEVAVCEVLGTGIWDGKTKQVVLLEKPSESLDETSALYTSLLRKEGII
eukprot:CAMPEP_0195283294 /NCGR_PEP_ID=MMETSP0707-20130614/1890_1 /TAXON_ID=33640 /ORGANISM="Asterionellopsis glacialis, Strain CCMP134" /LENGTH=273 /DNA_ID=CAMNT_0040342433 /DNA_START=69 /DNA_END=890 /DNA_ORIENTATION=+